MAPSGRLFQNAPPISLKQCNCKGKYELMLIFADVQAVRFQGASIRVAGIQIVCPAATHRRNASGLRDCGVAVATGQIRLPFIRGPAASAPRRAPPCDSPRANLIVEYLSIFQLIQYLIDYSVRFRFRVRAVPSGPEIESILPELERLVLMMSSRPGPRWIHTADIGQPACAGRVRG